MQRLHVVGFTKDHEGLILSVRKGTKTGAYTVDVDGQFEEVVADLLKERGGEAEPRIPRAESQLSVREMQQRLRSGQTIHQVARAAGVTDEWVGRFAIPIQAEQAQVVRQAFDLVMSKQRLGSSSQPLGISVWWNLQDRSVVLDEEGWDTGWSAALLKDNRWVVKFEYTTRKRHQVAEWEVDLRGAAVSSRNRLGTELGYVEPGRRRRPGPPPPVPGGLVTRAQPPVNDAPPPAPAPVVEAGEADDEVAATPTRKTSARRPAAKKALKKVPAKKRAPLRKVAAKKRPAPKKVTGAKKVTAKKAAPKKASPKKAAPKKAVAKKTTAKKATKKPAAKKPGAAAKTTARRVTPPPTVAPVIRPLPVPKSQSPIVSGGTRAGSVATGSQPNLTPAPAPSGNKKRLSFRRR